MKKTYITPTTAAAWMEPEQMIAESITLDSTNAVDPSDAEWRDNDEFIDFFHSVFDAN